MHKRKFKTSPGISCGLGMAKRSNPNIITDGVIKEILNADACKGHCVRKVACKVWEYIPQSHMCYLYNRPPICPITVGESCDVLDGMDPNSNPGGFVSNTCGFIDSWVYRDMHVCNIADENRLVLMTICGFST